MPSQRIMVVEDEAIVARHLDQRLRQLGFDVAEIVHEGRQAVERARDCRPDVVLMDIRLPGDMDGIQAATRIQELGIPVVYITGYTDGETLQRAAESGPFGFIAKPFEVIDLQTVIAMALACHRAEAALHATEESFRTLAENSADLIARVGTDGRFIYANRALCAMLDVLPEALPGKTVAELPLPADCGPHLGDAVQGVLASGEPCQFECLRRQDGQARWLDVRLYPEFAPSDELHAVLIFARDITAGKEAEAELIRQERLAAVHTLAAGISHEFNNINAALLGYLEMVLAGDGLGDTDRHRLEQVRKAAVRGTRVTRNLAAFSRQDAQFREAADPVALVEDTLRLVMGEFSAVGIQVDLRSQPAPPVCLQAGRFAEALMHLFTNAMDAMRQSPERRLEVRVEPDDDGVRIQVRDSGCGIPAEQLDHVFLPFVSGKGEHAPAGSPLADCRGSGLGLSVTRSLVAAHGGSIDLASTEHEGTTVTIHLPLAPPVADEPDQPVHGRVLVVDAEPVLCNLLREVLEEDGHEVWTGTTLEDAFKVLAAHPVDLILLDAHLPTSSVPAFLARLSTLGPGRVPSVLLTGSPTDLPGPLPPEVVGRIDKPCPLEMLQQRVRDLLARANPTP